MEVISQSKYIRLSATKARPIANLVRGKNARQSLESLKLMPQKAAKLIGKTLNTAIANAENNFNLDKNELIISKVTIDNGPVLKRIRPRAKGSASPIKKRTSHITVVVSGEVFVTADSKKAKETKSESVNVDNHKIEVDRPDFVKKEKSTANVNIKKTMFRRKTG